MYRSVLLVQVLESICTSQIGPLIRRVNINRHTQICYRLLFLRDLLEVVEDRHGSASTILTSQLPVEHWHEVIGDPTIADALLDRLVHNAHRISLKGESMTKTKASLTEQEDAV